MSFCFIQIIFPKFWNVILQFSWSKSFTSLCLLEMDYFPNYYTIAIFFLLEYWVFLSIQ